MNAIQRTFCTRCGQRTNPHGPLHVCAGMPAKPEPSRRGIAGNSQPGDEDARRKSDRS